jgi:hypothetical protein
MKMDLLMKVEAAENHRLVRDYEETCESREGFIKCKPPLIYLKSPENLSVVFLLMIDSWFGQHFEGSIPSFLK